MRLFISAVLSPTLVTRASPRLKDSEIPSSKCTDLYVELVLAVRTMFHQCKLVHADLSEYNVLYHDEHLYIIDVSQSVEHDHPSAFDFLRKDLKNLDEFFGRLGVECLGLRRSFEFVTKDKLSEDNTDEDVLRMWQMEAPSDEADSSETFAASAAAHEDSVFLGSYIPRSLSEVYDPERDVAALKRGEGKNLIYADTIGLVTPADKSPRDSSSPRVGSDESEDSESEEDSENDKGFQEHKPRGHRHEDREVKKVGSNEILSAMSDFLPLGAKKSG